MSWTAGHLQGTTNPSQLRRHLGETAQHLLCGRYRVAPEVFWRSARISGADGYDRIRTARQYGWRAVPSWGLEGWDLGAWPLVVVWHRRTTSGFELAYDVEGDVAVYRYPTRELQDAATDCLALWHWKREGKDWVEGVESIDAAPARIRGPFTQKRITTRKQPSETSLVRISVTQYASADGA
jgi:hypothetical protein